MIIKTIEDLKKWQSLLGYNNRDFCKFLGYDERSLYYIYSGKRRVPEILKRKALEWYIQKTEHDK